MHLIMSSSDGDNFFDDTESESQGKGDRRGKAGNAVRESSQSNSVSTEESSSEADGIKQPRKDPDDQTSDDDYNDDDANGEDDVDDNDGDDIPESVHEEPQNESDEGSRREGWGEDERVVNSDRSEELERLFEISPAGDASTPLSPKPSGSRPTSARSRVRVVIESAPGYSSSQKDLTGTRVKGKKIPNAKTTLTCENMSKTYIAWKFAVV